MAKKKRDKDKEYRAVGLKFFYSSLETFMEFKMFKKPMDIAQIWFGTTKVFFQEILDQLSKEGKEQMKEQIIMSIEELKKNFETAE